MTLTDVLLERPRVYRLWQSAFASKKFAPIVAAEDLARTSRVLDIGCGPGTNTAYFEGCHYVGIDSNRRYIDFARRRYHGRFLVAKAEELDLGPELFDFILLNSLLHHLDDDGVERTLERIHSHLHPQGYVHILDLVLPPGRSVAALLAKWDRGHHARSRGDWSTLLTRHFDPVTVEPYEIGMGIPLWHMIYFKGRAR